MFKYRRIRINNLHPRGKWLYFHLPVVSQILLFSELLSLTKSSLFSVMLFYIFLLQLGSDFYSNEHSKRGKENKIWKNCYEIRILLNLLLDLPFNGFSVTLHLFICLSVYWFKRVTVIWKNFYVFFVFVFPLP